MYPVLKRALVRGALALAGTLAAGAPLLWQAPAIAAMDKPWTIEYRSSLETTTNLQQQAGGVLDLALRNSLEFSYYPSADNDNSALFRLQALNSRYRFNPEFDSTFLVGTALASRRLINSTFGYGGYQLLFKQSNSATPVSRTDNDAFGGVVVYKALTPTTLVSHGYQFDFLRAAVAETSYQGHSVYVTGRQVFTDRWSATANLRSQWRIYDVLNALEWRNFVVTDTTYRMNDWWSLRGEVIYLFSTASRPELNFNGWNIGLFTQFNI
jgi:hypothetical protein